MKCDELEEEYLWTNNVKTPSTRMVRVYNADEVDAAIAELKARIQLDDDEMAGFLDLEEECGGGDLRKYIAELNAKLDEKDKEIESLKASHYAESVDAGMVDAGMENNILKRALWLTRALRARDIQRWWLQVTCSPRTEIACMKWNNVERKCRAKAEEYK